jgi:hypothetical protein
MTKRAVKKHGSISSYGRGCRCDLCRAAINEYQRKKYQKLIASETPEEKKKRLKKIREARKKYSWSSDKQRDYIKKRYLDHKMKAFELLGGKCVRCGKTEVDGVRLCICYKDLRNETSFPILGRVCLKWERKAEQLKQCHLLCTKCKVQNTSEITEKHGLKDMPGLRHGTLGYWESGCRCPTCQEGFRARKYKDENRVGHRKDPLPPIVVNPETGRSMVVSAPGED